MTRRSSIVGTPRRHGNRPIASVLVTTTTAPRTVDRLGARQAGLRDRERGYGPPHRRAVGKRAWPAIHEMQLAVCRAGRWRSRLNDVGRRHGLANRSSANQSILGRGGPAALAFVSASVRWV